MKSKYSTIIYLTLTAITVVGGYFFLRYAYKISDSIPFAQEIILIVLGTVATILITALLLNKQTEVELQKEQKVRFLDLRSEVYMGLLDHIEQVMLKKTSAPEDAIKLQFFAHRLSLVAGPSLLEEFENFLKAYTEALSDSEVSPADSISINRALANLSIKIRHDLIGEQDATNGASLAKISKQVRENTEAAISGIKA